MKNRALYSLVPLVFLVGCPLPPQSGGSGAPATYGGSTESHTYKCFEKERCRVTVVVTACSVTGITTNPHTLKVTRRLRDVPIIWTLRAPAGYTFATDGVHFKNKDLAAKQFMTSRAGSHEFVWHDANTQPGTFPYNVRVRHEGRDCPILDPIIINDGSDNP